MLSKIYVTEPEELKKINFYFVHSSFIVPSLSRQNFKASFS